MTKKCYKCGISDLEALNIDHMNNDGAAQRKVVGGGQAIYAWLKQNDYPKGFQVLCFNCNWKAHRAFKRSLKEAA